MHARTGGKPAAPGSAATNMGGPNRLVSVRTASWRNAPYAEKYSRPFSVNGKRHRKGGGRKSVPVHAMLDGETASVMLGS